MQTIRADLPSAQSAAHQERSEREAERILRVFGGGWPSAAEPNRFGEALDLHRLDGLGVDGVRLDQRRSRLHGRLGRSPGLTLKSAPPRSITGVLSRMGAPEVQGRTAPL